METMIVTGGTGRSSLSTLRAFGPRALGGAFGQRSRDRGLTGLGIAEVPFAPTPDPTLDVTPARLR